jgi:hypothetical protein
LDREKKDCEKRRRHLDCEKKDCEKKDCENEIKNKNGKFQKKIFDFLKKFF